MPAKILLVEDDEAILELLSYNLTAAGYHVHAVRSGLELDAAMTVFRPDLVVLDWMLPGRPGLELCTALRTNPATQAIGIIMLTARGDPRDRTVGLEAGADDYIVKPFSIAEFVARVASVLRRANVSSNGSMLYHGDLSVNLKGHSVTFKGAEIAIGPTEFRLFKELLEKRGRILTRSQLISSVWSDAAEVNDRTVDVHIGNLRRALQNAGVPDIIRTVRGEGYIIDAV